MSLGKHDPQVFYYDKLKDFLNSNPEKTELDFIKNEIDWYEDFIEKIKDEPTILESEMSWYKYYLNYFKDKERIYINENRLNNSEKDIDLSNTTAVQKIIYLNELGIIDLLRKENCFKTSTHSLAEVLSAITGEKTTTLFAALNPMLNTNGIAQKNNPYKSESTVKKVKTQLINLGILPK